jgi:hypothetical protein
LNASESILSLAISRSEEREEWVKSLTFLSLFLGIFPLVDEDVHDGLVWSTDEDRSQEKWMMTWSSPSALR